jgi:acyl carrier protein
LSARHPPYTYMTRHDFLSAMDNVLELPEGTLTGPEKLDDLENWNSLAMVEYIALADSNGAKLSPRQIRDCETVDELARLAKIE